jgi:hypothetical protein
MAYLVVENFSAGLDTRKHPLTAKPGTLQTLKNAHISRGGEIEKRKAFVQYASLAGLGFQTFGMEAGANTIYVFGSDPEISSPGMPVGTFYQRLQHPDGAAMTGVVYSTLYGGYPFVLAKFADGKTYPFYNGQIIGDFINGVTRSSMSSENDIAANLASVINAYGEGYSATVTGATVTVTGPAGVEFKATATTDAPITATIATIQQAKAAVAEVQAAGSFVVTNGSASVRASVTKNYLVGISTTPGITGIYANGVNILGSLSAGYIDYDTPNLPTGPTWSDPSQRLAYTIAYHVNANTLVSEYTASYNYGGSSTAGGFTIYGPEQQPQNYNNDELWIEFDADPTGTAYIQELITVATITASPYNAGRFIGKVGTFAGGVRNAVTSIKVDGVEVLGPGVQWTASNSATMTALAAQINSWTSSVEYVASVDAGKLVIKGIAGSGSTPNGRIISVSVVGDVVIGSLLTMSGGTAAVAAVPQKSTYALSGFGINKKVTFVATPTLDSANPIYWGATRVANTTPVSALTYKTKAHLTSGSSLFFSGVNQPTKWGENGVGAGFINLSNNNGGNETLTGLALYQGNLAAFSRRTVQVWAIDTDPALNKQGQVLSNTGALGAGSIVSVGDIDVFFLSDSGIRSLRARDSSNAAVVNDVGTPVDGLVLADLAGMTDAQKAACPAIIEPIDGRYWIAIGSKVYVFSYFPNSSVAAWSVYEPGFDITKFTTKEGRVYARAGNTIYLYGGTNNAQYDGSTVELVLPYLDGGKPAHMKTIEGLDMTCEGTWAVEMGMDPLAPNARDTASTVTQPTFSLGRVGSSGIGTHVGIRMVSSSPGYARLANLIVHFKLNESD